MTLYEGTILGFNYHIEFDTDEEFKVWLKAKLLRYLFDPNNPATDVMKDVLGIKILEEDVATLKSG